MKKLGIGLLASIVFILYKLLKNVFKFIYFILTRLFIYFGLHYPLLYLFVCSFLFAYNLIDFKTFDINSLLFVIGLLISGICMITTTFKNLIVNPKKLKQIVSKKKKEQESKASIEEQKQSEEEDKKKEPNIIVYPLIYHSKKNPKILIYEYETYYDVFKETENGTVQIDKKDKHVQYR